MSPGAAAVPKAITEAAWTSAETVIPLSMDNSVAQGAIEPSCCDVPPPSSKSCKSDESFCSPTKLHLDMKCSSSAANALLSSSTQCEPKMSSPGHDFESQGPEEKDQEFLSSLGNHPTPISCQQSVLRPALHHQREALCVTRPRYRQGRKLTAVKVYTVADESIYLLINGVPSISLVKELKNLCLKRGNLLELKTLSNYPKDAFTDVFLVKYEDLIQARLAKKFIDGRNFFGGLLHVCYAPEMETIEETRKKLLERRLTVSQAIARKEDNSHGSILAQYHPEDKLLASVKRISHRLKCDDNILQLNSGQLSARNCATLDRGETGTSKTSEDEFGRNWGYQKRSCGSTFVEPHYSTKSSRGLVGDSEASFHEADPGSSWFSKEQCKPPPVSMNCSSNSEKTSFSNLHPVELNCKKSEEVFQGNSSSETKLYEDHYPSLSGPVLGHTYSSMGADYEPGIGRISGEYYASTSQRDFKSSREHSGSNPRAPRKRWIEISDQIRKEKRKVQPRLSRLESRKFDLNCTSSETKGDSEIFPHLNVSGMNKINSNMLCSMNPTQTKLTHLPAVELFYVGSKTTSSAYRTDEMESTSKSDANQRSLTAKDHLDLKRGKSTSALRKKIRKIGSTTPPNNNRIRSSGSSKFQYLEAIRAAAAASFGPVPATAIRKVSQRQTPKMSQGKGVKLM